MRELKTEPRRVVANYTSIWLLGHHNLGLKDMESASVFSKAALEDGDGFRERMSVKITNEANGEEPEMHYLPYVKSDTGSYPVDGCSGGNEIVL